MKKILSIVFHPILLLIVGVLLIAAVIWLVGPLISIARTYPLESETTRFIAIGFHGQSPCSRDRPTRT